MRGLFIDYYITPPQTKSQYHNKEKDHPRCVVDGPDFYRATEKRSPKQYRGTR